MKKGCGMQRWGRIKFQPIYETQVGRYLFPKDTCLLNSQENGIGSIMTEAKN